MATRVTAQVPPPINKKLSLLLLGCWLAMQIFLLWKNGIYTEGESGKYIYEAKLLLDGKMLSSRNYSFYMTTICLITISLKLKLGYLLPVLFQLLLNLTATIFFYKWATTNFDRTTGVIASMVLIFFYPYQEFNTFLQTESIYYSLIVIITCYIFSIKKLKATHLVKISLLIILICFTRPTGILFLPIIYCYLYLKFLRHYSKPLHVTIIALTLIAFVFSLNAIMDSGGELNFMLPFIQEHIICGVPTINFDIKNPDSTNNNLQGIILHVMNNSGQFLHLAKERSIAFFGLKRDYFSSIHNVVKIGFFLFTYILSILSIRHWIKQKAVPFFYLVLTVTITWLTTVLTCDDWHNRFILAIYPLLLTLSLPALQFYGSRFTLLLKKD